MSSAKPESLEGQAARVRAHLLSTTALIERRSHLHEGGEGKRHPEDAAGENTRAESSDELADDAAADGDEVETTERERLEGRADRVREHFTESVEELERKAREKLLPILVLGSALMVVYTVAFGWMFYRTARATRRPSWW